MTLTMSRRTIQIASAVAQMEKEAKEIEERQYDIYWQQNK